MKLLHPEVDIVPGRAGQRPQVTPVREEQPLPGSGVLRLTNATTQENAYTVRLRCDRPFWQESWYTVVALPPGQGTENLPPTGKPDQRGPQDRWVKVYVPRGGTREVLIRFNVPAQPDARAGRYPYVIEVETQVIGPAEGNRRREHVSEVPGVAIVRPFYKWSMDVSPEECRVGRRHRRGEYEVVVSSEGNDWLYCDMHLPRPKDMQVDSPTLRLAVPPPEPGEMLPAPPGGEARPGTQRSTPLSATTRLKIFRGEVTRQPLMLSAQRVDAPSVAPPAADGYAGLGAVVAAPTTESQQLPGDRALVYYPPIPAKITDFFSKGAGSIRTLAFSVLGIAAAIALLIVLYQNSFYEGVRVEPQSLAAQPGSPLRISGQFLQGARLSMGTKEGYVEVSAKPDLFHPNRMTITAVPKELDHKLVKIRAQRMVGFLPFLTGLLPHYDSKSQVQVGSVLDTTTPVPAVDIVDAGPYKPGAQFTISGKNLGAQGAVLVGGLKAKAFWSAEKVTVTIRPDAQAGAQLPVLVQPSGGAAGLNAGAIEIAKPQQTASAAPPPGPVKPPPAKPQPPPKTPSPAAQSASPASHATAAASLPPPPHHTTSTRHTGPTPHVASTAPHIVPVSAQAPAVQTPPYVLVLAGNYAQAATAEGTALSRNPRDASAMALEAYALVQAGNVSAATPLAAGAERLTSGQQNRAAALAYVAEAVVVAANSKGPAAVQLFQKAGNADETLGLAYIAYANYLHETNQDEQAKRLLQAALSAVKTPEEQTAIRNLLGQL